MRKIQILLVCMASGFFTKAQQKPSPEIAVYTSFLENNHQSAKDYVLGLFNTHDIVVICERDHREITQYDLYLDIIRDKRFTKTVGNIFTEIGLSNLNPEMNDFLHTKDLPQATIDERLLNFHRNLSWNVMWEKYNYTYFMAGLYRLNNQLKPKEQVWLYPSEIPFYWDKVDSSNYSDIVKPLLNNRDSIIATQIIAQLEKIKAMSGRSKKALVIMNFRHAFNRDFPLPGGRSVKNVAAFLFRAYGDKVANVLLNPLRNDIKGNQDLIREGRWDAAFEVDYHQSQGFNLYNSPFGKDSLDIWPVPGAPFTYQDIFTGFVFYQPFHLQKLVHGVPGFLDSAYFDEFFRRWKLSALVSPNMKKFTDEEILALKKNPEDLEKEVNLRQESTYPDMEKLIKERDQWIK